jgi:hypothetical protein
MNVGTRKRLVEIAKEWQKRFGVAPAITNAISEFDAAELVGMTEDAYSSDCESRTAVMKGHDFKHNDCRYQVKANRPSGRRGSLVSLVGKARNYEWDKLIWILYDKEYEIQEAWEWTVEKYRNDFDSVKYLRPVHMRKGRKLK